MFRDEEDIEELIVEGHGCWEDGVGLRAGAGGMAGSEVDGGFTRHLVGVECHLV